MFHLDVNSVRRLAWSQGLALASVARLVGPLSCNRKIAGSVPGQGTYQGYRASISSLGTYGKQPVDASLSLRCSSLSLKMKKMSSGEDENLKSKNKIKITWFKKKKKSGPSLTSWIPPARVELAGPLEPGRLRSESQPSFCSLAVSFRK